MSDVNIAPSAPPAAAPAAPQATPGEVAVNTSPTASPQPVGSQAPPAPTGELEGGKGRPESRREAIQKAFEKADRSPAKPKMGHNNPPEPTQPEFNLRRPPPADGSVPDAPKEPTPRAEHGHFAPKAAQSVAGGQQPSQARPAPPPLPETAPYRDPPARMADHAKAEWAAAPESVRGEVYRMHREFDGAFQAYRGDHEAMNDIRPFHDLARQQGTTLKQALTNYVTIENKLRSDVIGGLDVIVNNLNLRTPQGQRIGLRDIAYHIASQTPEQLRSIQSGNAQNAQSHQIGQLHENVSALTQAIQQLHHERQYGYTSDVVNRFAQDHPRVDELSDLIAYEISLGHDLPTAYNRATLLRPTQAAQTRTPSAQTRSKSIHGAPSSGPSDGQRPRNDTPIGRRDAIANAIKRVNGAV
jgi:hypothetical protein